MKITSPENEYTVLTRLSDGYRLTALDNEGKPCLLIIEKNLRKAKQLTPLLQSLRQNKEFSDFLEFFPYKNGIAAVFRHYPGGAVLDAAVLDMPYPRRAEVLRGVFALILSQSLPVEFIRGVMYPENLMIFPSGKVKPLYDFPRGEAALWCTVRRICSECAEPEIDRLYTMTENAGGCEKKAMYEAAGYAADRLAGYTPPPEPEVITPGAILERARTVKAAVLERIAAILAVLAIIAGYIAVGVFFQSTVIDPPGVDNGIRKIGTVEVYDGG